MTSSNLNVNMIDIVIPNPKGRPLKVDKITADMVAYKKAHYIAHKEYILNYHSRTIECPKCNKTMKYSSKSKHLRDTCINRNQIN